MAKEAGGFRRSQWKVVRKVEGLWRVRISQWSCLPCSPWNLNKPFLLLVGYSAIFQTYTCNIEAYCYNEDCKLNCKSEFRIQFVWRVRSLLHSCSVFVAIFFFFPNLWRIKVYLQSRIQLSSDTIIWMSLLWKWNECYHSIC